MSGTTSPSTSARPGRRPGRRAVALGALLSGVLILVATSQPWVTATGLGPTSVSSSVDVAGSDAAQTVTAMGLVALAGGAAVSIARRLGRLIIAVLLLAAAAVTLVMVGSVVADPAGAAQTQLGDVTGTTEAAAEYALRPAIWLAAAGAALLLGPAALLLGSRGWPETRRYETAVESSSAEPEAADPAGASAEGSAEGSTAGATAGSAAGPEEAAPSGAPQPSGDADGEDAEDAEDDPFDLWDGLSRGDDPTDRR